MESIEIPDSVIVICSESGHETFGYCKNLKTVNIGKGIKSIGDYAFRYCRNLTTVNIGAEKLERGSYINVRGDSYDTGYGRGVFEGCSSLSLKDRKKIRDTGYTGSF